MIAKLTLAAWNNKSSSDDFIITVAATKNRWSCIPQNRLNTVGEELSCGLANTIPRQLALPE